MKENTRKTEVAEEPQPVWEKYAQTSGVQTTEARVVKKMRMFPENPLQSVREKVAQLFGVQTVEAQCKADELAAEVQRKAGIVKAFLNRKEGLAASQARYDAFCYHYGKMFYDHSLDAMIYAVADQIDRQPIFNSNFHGCVDPLVRYEAALRHGEALQKKLHEMWVERPQKDMDEFTTRNKAVLREASVL